MPNVSRAPLMLVPEPRAPDSERVGPAHDDGSLIAAVKARDPGAARAFYDRVRPIVDRTLTRLLGKRDHEYEDVAQRVLWMLIETLDRFRGDCPFDAWISILAARAAYRTIRRRRIERQIVVSVTSEDDGPVVAGPAAAVAARQALERIRAELLRMDPKRAWAFVLHDVHGYDLRETSQIMGSSLSAAQSRLVRGRRELHERIHADPALARFLRHHEEEA
jgi:RNA polymerase sigma-70 factor (ECF subfamily)